MKSLVLRWWTEIRGKLDVWNFGQHKHTDLKEYVSGCSSNPQQKKTPISWVAGNMSERGDWLKSPCFFFGEGITTLYTPGNKSTHPSSRHLNHLPLQIFPWQGTTAKSRKTSLGRHPVATIRVVRAFFKVKGLPWNITRLAYCNFLGFLSPKIHINKQVRLGVVMVKKEALLTSFGVSKVHIFRI